jgi:hypothetical protein
MTSCLSGMLYGNIPPSLMFEEAGPHPACGPCAHELGFRVLAFHRLLWCVVIWAEG